MHSIEVLSETSRTSCKGVVQWFMMEYLSDYGIDLTIQFLNLKDEGVDGWCLRESNHEFLIQIEETLEGEELTRTCLHECYHMYQHLNNIPRCEICAHLSETLSLDKYQKTL